MARLVIDTICIRNSVIGETVKIELLYRIINSSDTCAYTSEIISEYSRNIEAARSEAKRSNVPPRSLKHLFNKMEYITVERTIEIPMKMDDDDKMFLKAAVAGECNYVITQDEDFLKIKEYRRIKIISPDEYACKEKEALA